MKYRRWTLGVQVTLDPDECSVCGEFRSSGRHLPWEECEGGLLLPGRVCEKKGEHHVFQRRYVPLRFKRVQTW